MDMIIQQCAYNYKNLQKWGLHTQNHFTDLAMNDQINLEATVLVTTVPASCHKTGLNAWENEPMSDVAWA